MLFESNVKFDLGTLLRIEIDIPGWERFKNEFYKTYEASKSSPLVVLASVVRVEVVYPENRFDIDVCFSAIDKGHQWALIKYVGNRND